MKIFRVIGSEGRVTIPRDLRIAAGLTANEIVSFEPVSADAVLVRRERLQELPEAQEEMPSLQELLEGLTESQRIAAQCYLSVLHSAKGGPVCG